MQWQKFRKPLDEVLKYKTEPKRKLINWTVDQKKIIPKQHEMTKRTDYVRHMKYKEGMVSNLDCQLDMI